MICSRGYKEALYTITEPESQKFKSNTIFKKTPHFLLFFLIFLMMQRSGNLVEVTALLLA